MTLILVRFIPLLALGILLLFIWWMGWTRYLTFDELKRYHDEIKQIADNHPIFSPLAFIALYIAVAALSIPGANLLTLIGGFLFSQPFSTLFVLIGATIGGTCLFLAARTAFRPQLEKKAGPRLEELRRGFQENTVNYMLFLRLVPFFPFWLVNIGSAFLGVSFLTFLWTTFVGIIPGTFFYTQAGKSLDTLFAKNEGLTFNSILNFDTKISLLALGCLALLPILLKRYYKNYDR